MSLILQHPRIYSFLHIPVQAGSDAVLEEMKREYTVHDFTYIVEYLKERFVLKFVLKVNAGIKLNL